MMQECTTVDLRNSPDTYQIPGIAPPVTYQQIERLYPIAVSIFHKLPKTNLDRETWRQRCSAIRDELVEDTEGVCAKKQAFERIQGYSLERLQKEFEKECVSFRETMATRKEVKPSYSYSNQETSKPFDEYSEVSSVGVCHEGPLSHQERLDLEAISRCLITNYENEKTKYSESNGLYTANEAFRRKWSQRYQSLCDNLSAEEKIDFFQYDYSSLRELRAEELACEFNEISLELKALDKSDSNLQSKRIRQVAIAKCLVDHYEMQEGLLRKDPSHLGYVIASAASLKWQNVYDTVKGYRKNRLEESVVLFGNRGVRDKSKVSKQISRYMALPIEDLCSVGDPLRRRWQSQLRNAQISNVKAARKIGIVPPEVLNRVYQVVDGRVENSELYPFLIDIAQNKKAEFLPFSMSMVGKEEGIVGRTVDGQWLVVDPVSASAFSAGSVVKANFGINSTMNAFFAGAENFDNGGITAMVFFREARVYGEDGSGTTMRVAIKGFSDMYVDSKAGESQQHDLTLQNSEESLILPEQEWKAVQKVRGIPDVIQALGVLRDSIGGHIRAIIFPCFSGNLKKYMELLEGSQNSSEERNQAKLSIFFRIADALKKMHVKGLYHLDLKADNILINYDLHNEKVAFSDIAIADLPNILAHHIDIQPTPGICFKEEFDLVQNPKSLAKAEEKIFMRAQMDVRALGVMLHNAFASTQYPTKKGGWLNSSKGCQTFPDCVPLELQQLIRAMLSTDPAVRVPSMTEVAKELQSFTGVLSTVDMGSDCEKATLPMPVKRRSALSRLFIASI